MANKKINQLVSKTSILSTDLFGIGDATTGQLFKKTIAELQAAIGGAVISVNGLVGTVVLDTDDIQELATPTNKWFTDARARAAISLTVTGNSGASTYSSGTGVLNVPTYTLAGLGGISASFLSGTSGISYNSTTGVISYSGTVYTDASIRALLSGGTGITYNSSTGAISYSGTVYTDSSVRALISLTTTGTSGASTYNNTTGVINVPNYTLAGLGGISLTSLSGGTGITYNNTTGAISYSGTVYTDASVRALISASGSVSYNNTTGVISLTGGNLTEATSSVLTITGGSGAVIGGGTSIQVKQATTSVSGFLSSTDWTTFNNKQATITLTTTGTSGAATFSSNTLNIPQYAAALSGTTNYVAKFTSSTDIGNSLIYDNGTNVGIGRTPTTKLDVYSATGNTFSKLETGDNSRVQFTAVNSLNSANFGVESTAGATYTGTLANAALIGSNGNYATQLVTNNTARLTITSAGNVGIGTTSPSVNANQTSLTINGINVSRLDMQVSGTRNAGFVVASDAAYLETTAAIPLVFYTNSSERMRITSGGNVGIGTSSPNGKLEVVGRITSIATANNGIGAGPNFYLEGGGSSYTILQQSVSKFEILTYDGASWGYRMAIFSGGNVAIGTSSDNGYKLYVSGTIYATGNITANSDLTLKKNLELITNPTDKLMQLNGYSYQWKEDDSHQYGVIAQEVEKILPYAVSTGLDGIKGVSYNQIIPVLIEAVKEQKKELEELRNILASK